jgi:cell division protein FtsB
LIPREFHGRNVSAVVCALSEGGSGPDLEVERGSQVMEFKVKNLANLRRFPSAQDGLRAVADRAPRAEALAASWMERVRPVFTRVYQLRRRVATIAVAVLAGLLFVHVMFGANGMIVYKQKRTEYESLRKRIVVEQKENELYTQQIQGLQTDEKAIEKEAREQLHYARPGELVYVPQAPANPPPPANHSAKK